MNDFFAKLIKETIRGLSIFILFLPLFVSKNTVFPYIVGKAIFFQIIVEIIFFLWLILVFYYKNIIPNFKNPFLFCLTCFLGILFLTAFWGQDFSRSIFSTPERMTGIFFLLHCYLWFLVLISLFQDFSDWKKFLWTTIFVSFLVFGYATAQKLQLKFVIPEKDERLGSTLGNPIYFAVYGAFHIFFTLFLFLKEKNKILKGVLVFISFFNLSSLILGASKGAFFSFFISCLFFIFFLIIFYPSKKIKIILLFFLLAIMAAGGSFFLLKEKIIASPKIPLGIKRILLEPKIDEARIVSWQIALKGFKEKPLFGWGWENYNLIFNKYYDPLFQKWFFVETTWYDKSHNQVLDVLCMTGIFGLLVYLAFFYFLFKELFLKIKKKEDIVVFLVLGSFLFFYFLQNLFVFDTPSSLIIFYFSLGLCWFLIFSQKEKGKITKREKKGGAFFSLILCFILLIFFLYQFNFSPYQALKDTAKGSTYFKKDPEKGFFYYQKALKKSFFYSPLIRLSLTKSFLESANLISDQKQKEEIYNFIIRELKKSIAQQPKDTKNYMALGKIYLYGFNLNEAEDVLKKALELSPTRQEIYYDLGQTKLFQGNFEEGIEYYKKAVDLYPDFLDSHFYYALSLILGDKNQEGIQKIEWLASQGYNIEGKSADALVLISGGYFKLGNFDKALYFSNLALQKNQNHVAGLYFKALALNQLKRKAEAQNILQQLEKINPEISKEVKEIISK